MKPVSIRRGGEAILAGRVLCHDVRGDRNEIVFRKGHVIRDQDVPLLIACRWNELHLLELSHDDVGQREAGERLATSISGGGLRIVPAGHRHLLKSIQRGLLKVDVSALERLNSITGMAVFTLLNNQAVAEGEVVAEAQITPLAVERSRLEEAERLAPHLVRVLPFVPRDVVLWVRNERGVEGLTEKLRWFGCSVRETIALPDEATSIRASLEKKADARLFLIAGSNALDPLDPVFGALDQLGAKIEKNGMPVHPGTLLWVATWNEIAIVGLPTCGLGWQTTALDLVLAKLLAEGAIGARELAAMGHGGILRAVARPLLEPVDEPVR